MSGPVYIVCGGTGGHLAPGIATAQRLLDAGIRIRVIVSEKEVDSRLMESYPEIPHRCAKGAAFSLRPVGLARFIYTNLRGFSTALRQMRRERPVAILAFGGFLSVSYVIAAWVLRLPIVLHEANRIAGRSIRFLSCMADMIFLPDGVALPGVEPRRMRRIGMPLRKEVHHIPKDEIREKLGIPLHAKVLLVVGGSQGALALNEWVQQTYKSLSADGIWTLLVAGPGKNTLPEVSVLKSDQGNEVELRTFSFHHALHELFSCADVVLSRAGAGTIAELITCLAPSILVPFPYAADDHQFANARDLERRGGCILIPQSEMHTLYREILDLIYNDWLLGRIRSNLRSLICRDPASRIADFIIRSYIKDSEDKPATVPKQPEKLEGSLHA